MENLIPLIAPLLNVLLAIVVTIGTGLWAVVKFIGRLIADITGVAGDMDSRQKCGFLFLFFAAIAMVFVVLSWL